MHLIAKEVLVIAAFLAVGSIAQESQEYRVTRELTERVKVEATTWQPYEYEENPFIKDIDLRKRTGLILDENQAVHKRSGLLGMMLKTYKGLVGNNGVRKLNNPVYKNEERHRLLGLPQTFDARLQWPTCIGPVRNQQVCGSCYAFSATAMLQDRFCVATQGQIKVNLSPEDIVTCNFGNAGCQGGLLSETINYLITEGVVTEECRPYSSGIGL